MQLEPCPFCGSEVLEFMPMPAPWGVICRKCGAETCLADTKAEAIAAWNRRAAPTSQSDRRAGMSIDEIIAGMTEAQKAAVCGRYAWACPADEDEGERELYRLGLWNPRPKWGEQAITSLGRAVRARLEEQTND